MIEGLLEDDTLLQSIFEESNLTKTQLDSLLLAFQYKIEGYSLDEIVKIKTYIIRGLKFGILEL